MGQEKLDAAGESMRATVASVGNANQRLVRIFARSAWAGGVPGWERMTETMLAAWFETLERSIAPYHRRVMSNEVRLRRH